MSTISLVRHRDWLIPADPASYAILRKHGVMDTRIHVDVFPTVVDLSLAPAGVHGTVTSFRDMHDAWLDGVGAKWRSRPMFTCRLSHRELTFESTHRNVLDEARGRIEKLQQVVADFCERWGFVHESIVSETRGRMMLHVSYSWSADRRPIIPLQGETDEKPKTYQLDLGNLRIEVALVGQFVHYRVSEACGDEHKTVRQSRCLPSQVKGLRDFVQPLLSCAYLEASTKPID